VGRDDQVGDLRPFELEGDTGGPDVFEKSNDNPSVCRR
jgi:hypothetical protein